LKNVKIPYGYSSNISRCIDLRAGNIFGLIMNENIQSYSTNKQLCIIIKY